MPESAVKPKSNALLLLLQAGVVFLFLYQLELILAGLARFRITRVSSLGMFALALILAAGFTFAQRKKQLYPVTLQPDRRGRWLPVLITAGCLLAYVLLWALAVHSPDLSWDGNAYHIPPISLWASHGGIYWIDQPYLEGLLNGYPKGVETVAYGAAMAFGNDFLNTVNLWFLPLGALGIAVIAVTLGIRSLPAAIAAGALYLILPVNMNQSSTTYVDAAFAACVVAFIALWLENLKQKRTSLSSAFVLGAAASLALGAKSSAFLVIGLAVLIWIAVRVWDHARRVRSGADSHCGRWWIRGLLILLLTGAVALADGGFWYLRDWVRTGSPLYPVGLTVGQKVIFPGSQVAEAMAEEKNTPEEFVNLSALQRVGVSWLQGISKWPRSIRGYDSRFGGLGFLWLLAGIPAVLVLLIASRRLEHDRRHFWLLLILVGLAYTLTPMNWWSRYVIWIYALGLPAFALVMQHLLPGGAQPNRPLRAALGAWAAIALLAGVFEGAYCAVDNIALATPGSAGRNPLNLLRKQAWTWPAAYLYPEMQDTALEDLILNGRNVAIGPHGDANYNFYTGLVGQLAQPVGERTITFVDEDVTADELRAGCYDALLWDESVGKSESLVEAPAGEALGYAVYSLAGSASSAECP